MSNQVRQTHTIDAAGQVLGRLATRVAVLLRGKHKPTFVPREDAGDFVVIKNMRNVKFTGKKLLQKKYYRHSPYMGGLKSETVGNMFKKNPAEVLRKAVWGMLPKNKLRTKQIKRLRAE